MYGVEEEVGNRQGEREFDIVWNWTTINWWSERKGVRETKTGSLRINRWFGILIYKNSLEIKIFNIESYSLWQPLKNIIYFTYSLEFLEFEKKVHVSSWLLSDVRVSDISVFSRDSFVHADFALNSSAHACCTDPRMGNTLLFQEFHRARERRIFLVLNVFPLAWGRRMGIVLLSYIRTCIFPFICVS